MNIELNISPDKTHLLLALGNGLPTVAMPVSAVDDFIAKLSVLRAELAPAVARDYSHPEQILAIQDPRYWTNLEAMSHGSLLHIRHDSFGWLSFLFPPAERERLIGYLQSQTHLSASLLSQPKN